MVMVITLFSKALGFVREVCLSYVYGASAITDAYIVAQTIPAMILGLIGAGIGTSYIPLYSKIVREEGASRANIFTSNICNFLLILASVIVASVIALAQPIVQALASGFRGDTLKIAVQFTRVSVFGIYFTVLIHIFSSFLQIHGNHIVPAGLGLPANLIIVGSIFLSWRTNVYVLVLGSLVAVASQMLIVAYSSEKYGYRHHVTVDWSDPYTKSMAVMSAPVVLGQSVNHINVLIDRTLASNIAVGGISALNYANRLVLFIQGLFVVSIATVMYPMVSRMAAENDFCGLKTRLAEAISFVNLLIVPITVGAMIFSKEWVTILFGRGAFTPAAVDITSSALFYYSIGMIGFAQRDILSRAFYALQDTKTPVVNATFAVAINILLNIVLSRYMGIGGLALATSIAGLVSTFSLTVALRRKIGPYGLKEVCRSFLKIVIASALMGITSYASFGLLTLRVGRNMALVLAVIIGVTVYGSLIVSAGIPEVDRTLRMLKRKLRAVLRSQKEQV